MGIYQLRYLERVPAHAAVAESVELVKRARKRSAAGLVNAVLRKVHRDPVAWPDRATALSHPAWMLERWDRQYGPETAEAIARANLHPPETWLRVPAGAPLPDATLEPTEVSGCYRLAAGGPGVCRIQDIGSQSIVPLLDLRPGLSFLDLCAAPGNKTAQALEAGVRAVACDVHLHRLRMLDPARHPARAARRLAPPAVPRPLRPHPARRPLLRHRHPGPQPGNQVAPQARRPPRSSTASRPPCSPTPAPSSPPADGWYTQPVRSNVKKTTTWSPPCRPPSSSARCAAFPAATPGMASSPL